MPKLDLNSLDKELREKNLRPVYLIYGPEPYIASTALARIREYFAKVCGSDFEPDRYSAKSKSLAEIVGSADTVSMWTKLRLVIVSEADAIKETKELERYLKKPNRDASIVFVAEKADGRTKFVSLVSEAGAAIECKAPYENKLPEWIRIEATQRFKKMVSLDAARLMVDLVGTSLGELSGALEKIVLYIGAKPQIDSDDVETVLTETGRKDVFKFCDAVGARKLKDALHALERLSAFDENEVMLLTMLSRHFRLLLKAREAMAKGVTDKYAIAQRLGINPFHTDNYMAQARLFSMNELKQSFAKLYKTDKLIKSSKLPKQVILKNCVTELLKR